MNTRGDLCFTFCAGRLWTHQVGVHILSYMYIMYICEHTVAIIQTRDVCMFIHSYVRMRRVHGVYQLSARLGEGRADATDLITLTEDPPQLRHRGTVHLNCCFGGKSWKNSWSSLRRCLISLFFWFSRCQLQFLRKLVLALLPSGYKPSFGSCLQLPNDKGHGWQCLMTLNADELIMLNRVWCRLIPVVTSNCILLIELRVLMTVGQRILTEQSDPRFCWSKTESQFNTEQGLGSCGITCWFVVERTTALSLDCFWARMKAITRDH